MSGSPDADLGSKWEETGPNQAGPHQIGPGDEDMPPMPSSSGAANLAASGDGWPHTPAAMARSVDWDTGQWLNPPMRVERIGTQLEVEVEVGSDFWRHTYYGFVRDTGHALLAPLEVGQAVEVSFVLDLPELYDQAGVMVRAAPSRTGLRLVSSRPTGPPTWG